MTSAVTNATLGPALARRALHQLRSALERDLGMQAASYLQEAGFAAGEATHQALTAFAAERYGVSEPAELDERWLGEALGGFFRSAGWGGLDATQLGPVLALDSDDWAEALDGAGTEYPTCHLSSGMLADVLGRVAGEPTAVMEVECRSRGDARCRFLAGSPETLGSLYERMAQGAPYREALGAE
jgi:hypothetical protein